MTAPPTDVVGPRSATDVTWFTEAYRVSKAGETKLGFANLVTRLSEGRLSQLKIVLKADAQGSLESIKEAMRKLATDKVQPKVIHGAVGDISESDVMMAAASLGFIALKDCCIEG